MLREFQLADGCSGGNLIQSEPKRKINLAPLRRPRNYLSSRWFHASHSRVLESDRSGWEANPSEIFDQSVSFDRYSAAARLSISSRSKFEFYHEPAEVQFVPVYLFSGMTKSPSAPDSQLYSAWTLNRREKRVEKITAYRDLIPHQNSGETGKTRREKSVVLV